MSASPYRRSLTAPPRARRRRNPWVRVGLAAVLVATLPFAWSEDSTCEHLARPAVSGYEILFGKGWGPGGFFFAFLVLSAGLGFLARATYRTWWRLACEVVAGLAALGTFTMCAMMMTYGRREQPLVYPAAWIGVIAAVVLAFEAWWAAGEALRRAVVQRRAARAVAREIAREIAGGMGPAARIAEATEDETGEARDVVAEAEAEGEALAEEAARRQRREVH